MRIAGKALIKINSSQQESAKNAENFMTAGNLSRAPAPNGDVRQSLQTLAR